MRMIIIGGGKVGYYLTKTLIEHGHTPVLVEKQQEHAEQIANELQIPVICGDGTTISVLEDAETEGAYALISVSGNDEDNLVACQLAKQRFHVKRTVARVNNPKNREIMQLLGVDITVSSTDNIARMIEREVDISQIKQLVTLSRGEVTINEIQLTEDFKFDGKKLKEIIFPESATIAGVLRGEEFIIPKGNTILYIGDKILVIAKNTELHEISEVLGIKEG